MRITPFPGEGDGQVRKILADALAHGYDAGISIEPHMVAVFHDANAVAQDDALRQNYVEYGRRLERMLGEIAIESLTMICSEKDNVLLGNLLNRAHVFPR